jgi:hypothetical protein
MMYFNTRIMSSCMPSREYVTPPVQSVGRTAAASPAAAVFPAADRGGGGHSW